MSLQPAVAPGGRGQPAAPRFVYLTSFGSHQCDRVLRLGGRGAPGWRGQDLIQNNAAKKFDFPVSLHKTSKIMKKKRKISAWKSVYKVISRMLEENEKYRRRLECQKLSRENSNCRR